MSDTWMEGIRKAGEESDKRVADRNAFLDKIIVELDAVDQVWWRHYTQAAQIVQCERDIRDAIEDGDDNISAMNGRKRLKREIVSYTILPSVSACIRAGIVKPTENT